MEGNSEFLRASIQVINHNHEQHTIGLFDGGVVVVELAAKQVQPFLQVENAVIHVVAGTTLNDKHTLVGEVLGQSGGDDTASGATTDDNVVVAVEVGAGEVIGGSHVEC